ncbi:MAG: TAXI family TRAP transporter solute-binding subunit [Actinomycetota bacterium]|nr:TAXI family TRAP transporter solute-binding subunit [Actinomycetota bacterium]
MARISRLGTVLLVVLSVTSSVSGCDGDFEGTPVRIAAGVRGGVYHNLSLSLSATWREQLGIEAPEVLETSGSPDNMGKLMAGEADIAFSAADVAAEPTTVKSKTKALARIHDDYLHVVVRRDGPIEDLTGLTGKRVSVGADESGVAFIAERLLNQAKLDRPDTLTRHHLGLTDSARAFRANEIDAFFWSGGLPTTTITDLAAVVPLRLLDIGAYLRDMRDIYSVYDSASIPVSTYQLQGSAVNTLAVPNYLMVTDSMPDDVAEALVRGMFDAQDALAEANPAALAIDIHSAIETEPVDLHPGAARYYREEKV